MLDTKDQFIKIFSYSNDGVFVIDPAHDEILEVNPKACNMLGYSREELLSLGISSVHPNEMPKLLAFTDTVYAAGYGWTDEVTCLTKTGDVLPVEISASIAEIEGRSCVIAMVHDITERKREQEALRESEERYRSLYENTPVMMHSIDRAGYLCSINNYWLDVLGYERSEVIGRKPTEFLTEPSWRYANEVVLPEFFKTGFDRDVELQMIKKNGEVIDVFLSAVVQTDEAGQMIGASCFLIDVTKRKQVEQTLQESEERYRRLVELSPDAIVVVSEGKIVFANPAEATLMGASSSEELIGKSAIELLHPEDRTAVEERLRRIDEEGEASHVNEGKIVRLDGQVRDIEAAGAPIIYQGKQAVQIIGRDITNRKRAEQALRESEERYRTLVELSPESVSVSSEGKIVYVNTAGAKLLGFDSPDELLGRSGVDFVASESREAVGERIRRIYEEAAVAPLSEARMVRRDGHVVDVESTGALITYQGKPAVQVVIRDITDRKKAERALQESEEKYRELYQEAPIPYFSIGRDGRIQSANKRALELLGYRLNALIGRSVIDLYKDSPGGKAKALSLFQRYSAGESVIDEELEMCKANGDSVWVSLTSPYVWDTSNGTRSMVVDITERKRAGEALRELAVVEERNRLARELHDSATQSLYSQALFAEAALRLADSGDIDGMTDHLRQLGETSQRALKEMRLLVYELRPLALETEGFAGALQQRLDAVEARVGVKTRLLVEGLIDLPSHVEEALYRVTEEALNNTLKHAAATSVEVRIHTHAGRLELEVRDDGQGCWQPAKVGHFETREIRDRERAW